MSTRNPHAPGEEGAPYDLVLQRLAADLIGPHPSGAPLDDLPADTFLTGILFPPLERQDEQEPEESGPVDRDSPAGREEAGRRATARRPSVAGLSFALETERDLPPEIDIVLSGARYAPEPNPEREGMTCWRRRAIGGTVECVEITPGGRRAIPIEGFEACELVIVPGPALPGHRGSTRRLVTVVVQNISEPQKGYADLQARGALNLGAIFEFAMTIRAGEGSLLISRPHPAPGADPEARAAALLWRDTHDMAVGHTCSAAWEPGVAAIRTDWLPATHVRATKPNGDTAFTACEDLLWADTLAEGDDDEAFAILDTLCECYRQWIDRTGRDADRLPEGLLRDQGEAHLDTCIRAAERMEGGVAALRRDATLWRAFRLANTALARQALWKDPQRPLRWRPFQLAFVLLSLASAADPAHPEREEMDLVWFPTGGGKTEAYLLLTAFTIFARRLTRGARGEGVATIMRYTLRLLTIQQFERAAAMILAAELTRLEEGIAGERPISLGLWLGSGVTPNHLSGARAELNHAQATGGTPRDTAEASVRQLRACPACGTLMDWRWQGDAVHVTCPDPECETAPLGGLPVHTVDEAVYAARPSLVIGTADKFAQIARNRDTAALFGGGDFDPPDLIVQDELHLISGPLGAMAGLYETAIDALCTRDGHGPKIVGSTATIRNATDQVHRLFQRAAFQFPPSGLSAGNSGFAVVDTDRALGRLYVGVTTAGHSKPHALQAVAASLLQSATDPGLSAAERDAIHTLVGYFGSLRDLGGSVTLLQTLAQETIAQYAKAHGDPETRKPENQIEVTSRIPSAMIAETLANLEKDASREDAVDVALATNMISVGVDVPRLGLMVVDGQPKTISEYIQATSRVGRNRVPGLVVGLFNANRVRDRSRYETHPIWHAALYREVEATSVTPFAPRARDYALHAPLVALAAHRMPVLWDDPAAAATHEAALREEADRILARIRDIDPDEEEDAAHELKTLIGTWLDRDWLRDWWRDRGDAALLCSRESAAQGEAARRAGKSAWATPNSFRDVEATVTMVLRNDGHKRQRR